MALKCYRRTKNDGARYTTCTGSKPKPKGKNTSNKKKKNIPAGMAIRSKPKKKTYNIKPNSARNQTASGPPIKSLRRTGGGYR
jgi:hypothetical protein